LTKIIAKNFLKNMITNGDDRNEDSIWVEHETVDAEGDNESAPESSSEDDNI
jgi:hypothetical protein